MAKKPLNAYLAHLLTQANRQVSRQLSASGVPVDQWRLLVALDENSGATMGELAEGLALNHPTLTKIVDRMVDEALMYRLPDPHDRRKVRMFLSDKGRVLLGQHNARVHAHESEVEGAYGTADAKKLKAMLESLIKQMS